ARRSISALMNELPVNDPELQKKQALLDRLKKFKDNILRASAGGKNEMYKVAQAIDEMLNDPGSKPGDPKENVSLKDIWAAPDHREVRNRLREFRKDVLYGSPLVVSRKVGKGNSVAFLTTAGGAARGDKDPPWNGWAGGKYAGTAMFSYPMV